MSNRDLKGAPSEAAGKPRSNAELEVKVRGFQQANGQLCQMPMGRSKRRSLNLAMNLAIRCHWRPRQEQF